MSTFSDWRTVPWVQTRYASSRSLLRRSGTSGPVTRSIAVVPELVVVTGPIGSGKSSVTKMLAERFSEAGRSVAVVDLDDIVAMLHAPLESVGQSWERARDVHGHLVGEWLSSGVDVVIVDGPFCSLSETAALMQCVPTGIVARRVMPLSTYEMALTRVAGDPSRGVSKDRAILRLKYEEFARELPSIDPCEWTFDTSECSVGDVVTTVAVVLLAN
jgi:energy-coupling factor transporter ATP-binding protein EcfA2